MRIYFLKISKRLFIVAVLLAFVSAGCGTLRVSPSAQGAKAAQARLFQSAVVDLEEALIVDQKIYLKYRTHFNETASSIAFFAQVDLPWGNQANDESAVFYQVPLMFLEKPSWENVSSRRQLDVIPQEQFQQFRSHLAHALAPQHKNSGVLLKKGKSEFVVFYDENDQVSIQEKKEINRVLYIEKVIEQDQLAMAIVDALKQYLDLIGKKRDQVILVADLKEESQQVFLFVDLKASRVVGISLPDSDSHVYKPSIVKKNLKTLDYIFWDSHVWGLLSRPVSSSWRLFSWSKDTAYDFINPKAIALLENHPPGPLWEGEGMNLADWEKELDTLLKKPSQWGSIQFLIGGEEYFPRMEQAFNDAKDFIEVRTFIFDNDDYGVNIADLLKKKSKERGMRVKVLLDAMGQVMGEGKIPEDLPVGFKPPEAIVDYLKKDSKVQVRVRPSAWFKADHTKTINIDGDVVFTGGMNIGREYRYNWHDLMMEVRGPIIEEIRQEFRLAWEHSSRWGDAAYVKTLLDVPSRDEEDESGYPVRALYTRLNDPQIFRAQLAAIRKAQKYIYIHNAYFSDNVILYELIRARRRGVDVRVVLPINGNHEIMNSSNVVTANIMFRNGIRVYFYPGMSHVKAAVYDGWVCSGSANFDKLSLRDNLEFNLATSEPSVVNALLKKLFEPDFKESKEMTAPIKHGLKDILGSIIAEQL